MFFSEQINMKFFYKKFCRPPSEHFLCRINLTKLPETQETKIQFVSFNHTKESISSEIVFRLSNETLNVKTKREFSGKQIKKQNKIKKRFENTAANVHNKYEINLKIRRTKTINL